MPDGLPLAGTRAGGMLATMEHIGPAKRRTLTVGARLAALRKAPDLQTQWEDLMNEVWRQESFERDHPYTCGVIRDAYAPRRRD